ncbi:LysR family transcriptional regulator [Diaphorobacter sp. HDW4A]|uniref:LysR family transcriptional regulator n=1 Tax=Diaphorobacter sp. HDW4A TaxID=2714924 RepID=UPI00140ABBFE|nr:LysR family transcriptional regulator [Diaphorobacter sp. HDW4A]QIL83674.1 LysR family transcriptional regulator [Diaphorobacter sp. HDW4A]
MLSAQLQDTALRYLLEVVRSGSVSEAATRLNVTPSAVSRQIATLEDLLGVPLFERRPRGMVASPAGEVLANHARRNALEAERAVSDIQALQGLRRGMVRICSSSGFAIEFLPRVIAQFREQYPGMQFQLRVCGPQAATQALLRGDADIAVTYSRTAERDIAVAYRGAASIYAFMRPDHPLSQHSHVTLRQLQPHPLALPDAENTVRQLFDIACSQKGLVFDPVLVCNQFEALMHFVLYDGGVSIAGGITVRDRVLRGELHAAPIRERGLSSRNVEVQTMAERTLPEGPRAFMHYLIVQLESLAAEKLHRA